MNKIDKESVMLMNTSINITSNNSSPIVANNIKPPVLQPNTNNNPIERNTKSPVTHSQYRRDLKKKILISQRKIREKIELNNAKIIHRTNARNCKSQSVTIADEQTAREAMMAEQIRAWRKI